MRDEKFNLYDKAFFVGLLSTVAVFATLNIIIYLKMVSRTQENKSGRNVTLHGSPLWGFPFEMNVLLGLVINFLIIAFLVFLIGFVFKFVWAKLSSNELR